MTRADFFISYAQSDRAWAEWIAWKLEEAGYATVLQAWDFTPGSDWASEMQRAMTSARKTIAVMSSAYLQSGYGEAEWRVAFASDPTGEGGLLVPVRVENLDPPGLLRTRVYIDLVGLSEADAAARLLDDISRDPDKSKQQPRFPALAAAAQRAVPPPFPGSGRNLDIEIVEGDVIAFAADLVAFKYAQYSYGADRQATLALANVGIDAGMLQPEIGKYSLVNPGPALAARQALFIGVPPLLEFRYGQIRDFGNLVVRILSERVPDCRHLALTLHGPGFGLDEVEALFSMLTGCMEAVAHVAAPSLELVSVVERDATRVGRLRRALQRTSWATDHSSITETERGWLVRLGEAAGLVSTSPHERSQIPGTKGEYKPRIFVAMPFDSKFSDLFEYGIQRPVRDLGFLCERADEDVFTGDVLERIKSQIEASTAMIAVLTEANPNVYLEVGYAWGKGRPTILVTDDPEKLKFDVRGQRCLSYRRIKDVEEALVRELQGLKEQGGIQSLRRQ